jgi:MtrB/PioB family decaheme-associated outer membrane protein
MNSHTPVFLVAALGLLSVVGPAHAVDTSEWKCETCPFPKGTSGSVEAGVGNVSDDSSKFGDYTGLEKQGAFAQLGGTVSHRSEGGGYWADLSAADLGLDTRSVFGSAGREGLYTLRLGYSEIPRHLTVGAQTPYLGIGSDVLTLPAGVGFPAGTTAAMPLATTLRAVELDSKRQRYDLAGSIIGGPQWVYRVSLRREVHDGLKTGFASMFSSASQLAFPVDHVTDEFEVSASYATARLQATLGYTLSQFRNGNESLTWDNRFLRVVAGADRGRLALAPDNRFQQVFGSAGYQLTPMIRASADFAVGQMTQDEAFLPYTINATLAPGVPALPAASLDGHVNTYVGNVRVTATPLPALRVNASYSHDERDNRTGVLSYAPVSTDMFLAAQPRSNTPFSYTLDRFKLGADYRGPGTWKFAAGVEHERRDRSYTEVVNTRETTLWGRASVRARDNLMLSGKLSHSERDHSTYGVAYWFGDPENPLLRKFNLASRTRDSGGLRADLTLNERVSLGLAADFANDDYDESLVGLKEARSASVAADVAVNLSEATQLTGYVHSERIRSLQDGSQAFAAPDWRGRVKDRFEMLGAGVRHAAIPDKLDLGADLTFSRSRSDVSVDAGASDPPFPTARTAVDSLKLYANYKINDKVTLIGSFWYERYSADDWRLDGVSPDTVPSLLLFGEQAPRYRVNVLRVAVRYRF